ncbi:Acyl carrier protein [Amycolatopsis arida]|uniref:Acyl carrier protein n=1 Tax=Amycolatopsis arida TaxID=587909 RepID=A0A1I6AKG1_9PSEU|nr:acyl carrier protein [Amycolatopsis arida]TDX87347.1 acyl carrier protein [Amycolatopsis arida]SFQ69145.1 Acyl carrier protein [Amycolatopsis arida]
MSGDSGNRPTGESRESDVTGTVATALAEVLYLDVSQVDLDAGFETLGLDSIIAVEFVAMVKDRLGVAETVESLYERQTPRAFAEHVRRTLVARRAVS